MANPTAFDEDAAMGIVRRYPVGLALKPPHTTEQIQTCDRKNFGEAKPEWADQKAKKLQLNLAGINVVDGNPVTNQHGQVYLDEDSMPMRPPAGFAGVQDETTYESPVWLADTKMKLDYFDLVPCLAPTLDRAFAPTVNLGAYSECGLRPYNSLVYWQVLAEELRKQQAVQRAGGSVGDMKFDVVTMLTGNKRKQCTVPDAPNDVAPMESRASPLALTAGAAVGTETAVASIGGSSAPAQPAPPAIIEDLAEDWKVLVTSQATAAGRSAPNILQ